MSSLREIGGLEVKPLRGGDAGTHSPLDSDRTAPILLSTSRVRRGPPSCRIPPGPTPCAAASISSSSRRCRSAPTHGWGIGLRIQELSRGRLDANQGSLYPALQRLEHRGDIESEWRSTENNRRARYYTITRQGRRALGEEVDRWKRFAAAIGAGAGGRLVSRLKGIVARLRDHPAAARRRGPHGGGVPLSPGHGDGAADARRTVARTRRGGSALASPSAAWTRTGRRCATSAARGGSTTSAPIVRYALRAMRRSPGFALAVALTLGVGIGVNGMVVGYVNAILFRPDPGARRPSSSSRCSIETRGRVRTGELGYEDYLDYRDRSGAFADLAGDVGRAAQRRRFPVRRDPWRATWCGARW